MNDSTCDAPCWNGITPGVTGLAEVTHLINSLPVTRSKPIRWADQQSKLTPRVQVDISKAMTLFIFFYQDKVACILFQGEVGYQFGDVVRLFGEPEYITVTTTLGEGRVWFAPSSSYHTVLRGIQPTKGIAFGYDDFDNPRRLQGEIHPEIVIDYLLFFDTNLFGKLANEGYFLPGGNTTETKAAMTPWVGYKKLGSDYPYAKPIQK